MSRYVRRKWGWYFVLLDRRQFKVKLLRFDKGGELSLQKHSYRGEAWMVLKGSGDKCDCVDGWYTGIIGTGDYWHIGKEKWHKFRAYCVTWILEVQYGDKCEESDIVRI